MIKIRISYEREQELLYIQKALSPIGMKWRRPPKKGKYFRAYAEADPVHTGLSALYREAEQVPKEARDWNTYEKFKRQAFDFLNQYGVNPWDYMDEYRQKIADILKL